MVYFNNATCSFNALAIAFWNQACVTRSICVREYFQVACEISVSPPSAGPVIMSFLFLGWLASTPQSMHFLLSANDRSPPHSLPDPKPKGGAASSTESNGSHEQSGLRPAITQPTTLAMGCSQEWGLTSSLIPNLKHYFHECEFSYPT